MIRDNGGLHPPDENRVDICPEVEELLRSSTPSMLGDKIARELSDYTVAFITSKKGDLWPAGSGTLVSFRDSYYVLTAAHVWLGREGKEDGLSRADRILIPLKEDQPTRFSITRDEIVSFAPEISPSWNEWGPDLMMLRLPRERIGSFLAVGRSFYNLSKKKERNLDCVETKFLMGAPSERGTFSAAEAYPEVQAMLLNKITGHYQTLGSSHAPREDFDYIDLGVDNTLPGVAKRFCGVSGGGLWNVYIYRSIDGLDSFKVLFGVAYWEEPFGDDLLMVRCHGPQAIGTLLRYVPK
jgi:hypothetical protein